MFISHYLQSKQSTQPQPPHTHAHNMSTDHATLAAATATITSNNSNRCASSNHRRHAPGIQYDKLLFGGRFGQIVSPKTHNVEQAYPLHKYQTVIVARNKQLRKECLAMRLRIGRVGYSQWLNELQVYLLPNFNNEHIAPFIGCDKRLKYLTKRQNNGSRSSSNNNMTQQQETQFVEVETENNLEYFDTDELLKDVPDDGPDDYDEPNESNLLDQTFRSDAALLEQGRVSSSNGIGQPPIVTTIDDSDQAAAGPSSKEQQQQEQSNIFRNLLLKARTNSPVTVEHRPLDERKSRFSGDHRTTIEYWILNDYSGCITLRHYLMMHAITWPELLKIARGILSGLHYLHEHHDYQNWDTKKKVDRFIRCTNGAIKKIAFKESSYTIHMKPHLSLSIIHNNLSSLNVLLRADLTPCIWNFGQAYICHPFQPVNHDHIVDWPIKKIHETSPYSPPEVLSGRSYLLPKALKAIDMYACGILFWELMSRCSLPPLVADDLTTDEEKRERLDPNPYTEPFVREFGGKITYTLLQHAVCKHRCRPVCRRIWTIGKKTNRFMQTIRELWDHDYDARLHVTTVLDRLNKLSAKNTDRRYRHPPDENRSFDIGSMWFNDPETLGLDSYVSSNYRETNMTIEPLEDL